MVWPMLGGSRPPDPPAWPINWGLYLNTKSLRLLDAVALTCGINPEAKSNGWLDPKTNLFDQRLKQALADLGYKRPLLIVSAANQDPTLTEIEFSTIWLLADLHKWSMPPELEVIRPMPSKNSILNEGKLTKHKIGNREKHVLDGFIAIAYARASSKKAVAVWQQMIALVDDSDIKEKFPSVLGFIPDEGFKYTDSNGEVRFYTKTHLGNKISRINKSIE